MSFCYYTSVRLSMQVNRQKRKWVLLICFHFGVQETWQTGPIPVSSLWQALPAPYASPGPVLGSTDFYSSVPAFSTLHQDYLDLLLSRLKELPLFSSSSFETGWWSLPQTSMSSPEPLPTQDPPKNCAHHANRALNALLPLASNQIVVPMSLQYPNSRGKHSVHST